MLSNTAGHRANDPDCSSPGVFEPTRARNNQLTTQSIDLRSQQDLRFAVLFLSLTVLRGLGELLFGVIGALASTASSGVLVGTYVPRHQITPGTAVLALFLTNVVSLVENVVLYIHSRATGL